VHESEIKRRTNWSTQCAVVSTHWAAINDPAQRELRAFLLRRAICHGQLRGRDSSPPTILAPVGGSTGRPQVSGTCALCRCARNATSCECDVRRWRWRDRCDVANWRWWAASSPLLDSSVIEPRCQLAHRLRLLVNYSIITPVNLSVKVT